MFPHHMEQGSHHAMLQEWLAHLVSDKAILDILQILLQAPPNMRHTLSAGSLGLFR